MKTKTGFIVGLAFSVVAGPLAGLAESPPNRETTHAENERPLPIDLLSHKFVVTATSASPAELGGRSADHLIGILGYTLDPAIRPLWVGDLTYFRQPHRCLISQGPPRGQIWQPNAR